MSSISLKQTLSRAFCLSTALFCLTAPSSAWALFSDDEARKAILDLRKSLATTQLELQGQIDKLKTENADLRGKIENLEKQSEDINSSQKTYYQDLDTRLGNFEPRTITIEGVSGTVQPGEKKAYEDALKSFQSGSLKKADEGFSAFIVNGIDDAPYRAKNNGSRYADR